MLGASHACWGPGRLVVVSSAARRFPQQALTVRLPGPTSWRSLSSRAVGKGARVKPLPHQAKVPQAAATPAGLEKLFAGGLDDGTYEVTVYASSQGSRFVLYSGVLGFCLSFALF
eukprot:EG_transcript_52239